MEQHIDNQETALQTTDAH